MIVEDLITRSPVTVTRGDSVVEAARHIGVIALDDVLIHLGRTLGVAAALIRAEVAGLA